MVRLLCLLVGLLLAVPALAQDFPDAIDFDFTTGDGLPAGATFSRNSIAAGYTCDAPRRLKFFAPNVPATHLCDEDGHPLGIGIFGSRIIQNAWSRDLTKQPDLNNGVQGWLTTDAQVAQDQVGMDGVPNSASSLTATRDGGMVCQAVGGAAQNRVLTTHIKAITLTGKAWVTQDGQLLSQVDTEVNQSSFTRVPRNSGQVQSVYKPNICIILEKAGDKIAVDLTNLENDVNYGYRAPSSPVWVTNVSFTIVPADILQIPLAGRVNPDRFTILLKYSLQRWYGQSPIGNSDDVFELSDGTTQNTVQFYNQHSSNADPLNDDFAVNSYYSGFNGGPKTRCSFLPPNQLLYLVPPVARAPLIVGFGYDTNTGFSLGCDNGSGSGVSPDTFTLHDPNTLIPAGSIKVLTLLYSTALQGAANGHLQRMVILRNEKLRGGALMDAIAKLRTSQPPRVVNRIVLDDGSHLALTGAVQPTTGTLQCAHCR